MDDAEKQKLVAEKLELNLRLEMATLRNRVAREEDGGLRGRREKPKPIWVRFFSGLLEIVGGALMLMGGSIIFGACAVFGGTYMLGFFTGLF